MSSQKTLATFSFLFLSLLVLRQTRRAGNSPTTNKEPLKAAGNNCFYSTDKNMDIRFMFD